MKFILLKSLLDFGVQVIGFLDANTWVITSIQKFGREEKTCYSCQVSCKCLKSHSYALGIIDRNL